MDGSGPVSKMAVVPYRRWQWFRIEAGSGSVSKMAVVPYRSWQWFRIEADVLAYDENDDIFEDIVVDDRAGLSG